MSNKPKPIELGELLRQGASIEEIKIRGPEDPEDRLLRRRKDFLAFLIKDLLPYLVAFLVIGIMVLYCTVILAKYVAASAEGQMVWPIMSSGPSIFDWGVGVPPSGGKRPAQAGTPTSQSKIDEALAS
jgi:hypothetical protein